MASGAAGDEWWGSMASGAAGLPLREKGAGDRRWSDRIGESKSTCTTSELPMPSIRSSTSLMSCCSTGSEAEDAGALADVRKIWLSYQDKSDA